MRATATTISLAALLLLAPGCSSDRVEESAGSVLLSVSNFDNLATRVSVNLLDQLGGQFSIGSLTISNIPKNPNRNTSSLQNVEMETYEVSYTRIGAGTQTPTTLVRNILGVAPVSGTLVYTDLPLMGSDQLDNPPLSDLLEVNGGFDRETNSQVITLNLNLTFFGRTIAGDRVATQPVSFTVEFVP